MSRSIFLCLGLILWSNSGWGRTWTSSSGKYTVEAEFIEMKDGNVLLKKQDGTTVAVPLLKLSVADREFIAGNVRLVEGSTATSSQPASTAKGGEAAIRGGLAKTTRLSLVETPLQKAITSLRDSTHTEILLDYHALAETGISVDSPLNTALDQVTLSQALDLILEPLDLVWDVRHEVIIVTTKEQSEAHRSVVVYQVAPGARLDQLAAQITTNIQPSSWVEVGGRGAIESFGSALVISQTSQIHRHIIKEFNKHLRPAPRSDVALPLPQLGRPVKMSFDRTPLIDALAQLQKTCKLAVKLDEKSLNDVGIGPQTTVTISVDGVSTYAGIELLLWRVNPALTWKLDRRQLIVTTKASSRKSLTPMVYDVQDLAIGGKVDPLIDLIATLIEAGSWNFVGGPASIRNGPKPGTIAIAQTIQVHLEIDRLLKDLRVLHQ